MREKQLLVASLTETADELLRTFGAWPTVWALVRAMRRRRRLEARVSHLSDRMLRDMGLPGREQRPEASRPFLWDLRN